MRSAASAGAVREFARRGPRLSVGVGVEAAWAAAHLVMYPLGAVRGTPARGASRTRPRGLRPQQRGMLHHDVGSATRPILLVHGMADNHAIFTRLDRALRRRGFESVVPYDYGLLTRDVPRAAHQLGVVIRDLARASGHEQVHVVGHSLGGLLARYFVQCCGGDAVVNTLVTLATPHGGTELARLVPVAPLLRQLSPRSPVIAELAAPAPGCRTRFLALASDIDHLVVPGRLARLDHPDLNVTNLTVTGVGHLSMPNNARVADTIARALSADRGAPGPEAPADRSGLQSGASTPDRTLGS